jgi:hypothetical protein
MANIAISSNSSHLHIVITVVVEEEKRTNPTRKKPNSSDVELND